MILQFRIAAIGILGSKVLKERGLIGICFDSLEYCGEEIREVFQLCRSETPLSNEFDINISFRVSKFYPIPLPTLYSYTVHKARTALVFSASSHYSYWAYP